MAPYTQNWGYFVAVNRNHFTQRAGQHAPFPHQPDPPIARTNGQCLSE